MGRDSKVYAERKWYCHHCGDGPLNYRLDLACPICSHGRCEDCRVIKIKPRH